MKNIITTIPAGYFNQWKCPPHDPRIARYLQWHDGSTLRSFLPLYGWHEKRPEYDQKPWYWMVTAHRPLKQIVVGESVCFITFKGEVIGYFDVVGVGTKKEFAWIPDEEMEEYETRGDGCIALANWHPGKYGQKQGFQGIHYTELRP